MTILLERTNCPYCGFEITRDFDSENRLFGTKIKCESQLCDKEFVVNTSSVFEKGKEPQATIREVTHLPKEVELDEDHTILWSSSNDQ